MNVRFKDKYAETTNGRLSYELVSDVLVKKEDKHTGLLRDHYQTKLLGLIPKYLLEEADGSEYDAIYLFTRLSNLQSQMLK